jgi:hypothetical protein
MVSGSTRHEYVDGYVLTCHEKEQQCDERVASFGGAGFVCFHC